MDGPPRDPEGETRAAKAIRRGGGVITVEEARWLETTMEIVEGKGKASEIQARIKQLRTRIDETTCGKSSKLIKNPCP